MSKRYVFWRQPNGKHYGGSDERHALREVLASIGSAATVLGGSISFDLNAIRFETTLKPSLVVIGPDDEELNSTDAFQIVRTAISAVLKKHGRGAPVSPKEFLLEADKAAGEYFRKAQNVYTLVTMITVKSFPAKQIRVKDSVIRQLSHRRKYPYPDVVERAYPDIYERMKRYRHKLVSVRVTGRTMHEAVTRALGDLGLLRGLWTLFARYGSWSLSIGSTKRKPIGTIHSGPVYTLHDAAGKPVDDLFWFDADFDVDHSPFDPSKGWATVEKRRKWAIARLKRLPYRRDLEDVLTRYATALDQTNLDVAFLHLWSILEKVTDTVGADYDRTISRAVWAYNDRKLAAEMLGAMRLHRNRLVHAAHSATGDVDQIVYMVKSFIDPHLVRLLRNDFGVTSFEDYGKLLSLPTNTDTLHTQFKRLRKTISFFERHKKK